MLHSDRIMLRPHTIIRTRYLLSINPNHGTSGFQYKAMLFKFMSFLDGIAYSADNDTVDVSVERLGLITTDDVVHYLHFKAYGTQHPAEDDFNNPPLCCFVTLLYHKKAISYFLRLAGNSNATSALEVNFKIIRYPSLCSSPSSQQ